MNRKGSRRRKQRQGKKVRRIRGVGRLTGFLMRADGGGSYINMYKVMNPVQSQKFIGGGFTRSRAESSLRPRLDVDSGLHLDHIHGDVLIALGVFAQLEVPRGAGVADLALVMRGRLHTIRPFARLAFEVAFPGGGGVP